MEHHKALFIYLVLASQRSEEEIYNNGIEFTKICSMTYIPAFID